MSAAKPLRIINARENNLKSVSCDIPHDQLVVLTGRSGSGKSSLAFGTVYAEGQRRYIETFSPYTRQFLDKIRKPDVDLIEQIRPALAIQQRTRVTGSRSTVGSLTNCNDYLKTLWCILAEPACPACGAALIRHSPMQAATAVEAAITAGAPAATWFLSAPLQLPEKRKELQAELERLQLLGYSRYIDFNSGTVADLNDGPPTLTEERRLLLVLDRARRDSFALSRAAEAVQHCYNLSRSGALPGRCLLYSMAADQGSFTLAGTYCEAYCCACGQSTFRQPTPALFSYNHPLGACPTCKGFGRVLNISPALVIPEPRRSIKDYAIGCWATPATRSEYRKLLRFCEARGIDVHCPWSDLTAESRELIFSHRSREYRGVLHWFKALERKVYKMHVRVFLSKYRSQELCPECRGSRLTAAALAFKVRGITLPDFWQMPIAGCCAWLEALAEELTPEFSASRELQALLSTLRARFNFLDSVGLGYLTLDRQARTLSGGETQRVNLAAALGSGLVSTQFVLDEPSVGLHARDTDRLLASIRALQRQGNSVMVVEHDLECIRSADHIVELGPGAGQRGGEVVYNGPLTEWPAFEVSDQLAPPLPEAQEQLQITGISARNLKRFNLTLPLHRLIAVSGVSGSGKSTLVREVLVAAWEEYRRSGNPATDAGAVTGFSSLEQLLVIDQSPLARSPRGNVATYLGIWERVRTLLAQSDDALGRGLTKSAFSFNVDGGRCPECKGAGYVQEDMQFLSDVYLPCESCLGRRFRDEVLAVRYRGLNVHELLQMSAEEAAKFFHSDEEICAAAELLCGLGLGHLTLGHPLSELSGGEAQRLKVIPFIQRSERGRSLLVFDEPTTGLHYCDVRVLIDLMRRLVGLGHTVLCVEHNLSLIAAADYLVDLGPEGGDGGGELLFAGTPAELVALPENHRSFTAKALRRHLQGGATGEGRGRRAAKSAPLPEMLLLRGARENNLQNVDLAVPLRTFVALTGVSGSGKSTIAKDIIYAEGQRRYLDCLSPYARQFIQELQRPDIDAIDHVPPTICVYQHTFQPSSLSTVGTMSEVYNYLRLLYAKIAIQHCPDHPEQQISPLTEQQIAAEIGALGVPVRILAPIIKKKKGTHREVLARAVALGLHQIRVDGVLLSPGSIETAGGLQKSKAHSIDFVVGKFDAAKVKGDFIEESVRQAIALSGGTLGVLAAGVSEELIFSTERTCPLCKRGFFKPDPEDLSFHSRRGACEKCLGRGADASGAPCRSCDGSRLNAVGRSLRLGGLSIAELSALPAADISRHLAALPLRGRNRLLADALLRELEARLAALQQIGLEYLPISRDCATLSTGELQRLRLSAAIGTPLSGALYIFDEPSAGLHPRDNTRVLMLLRALADHGNSVLMIEHDPASIAAANWVIECGPGGGRRGGRVTFSGPKSSLLKEDSATAAALRELNDPPRIPARPERSGQPKLRISGGSCNNISDLTLDLPLQSLIAVCGVSGAGKSSFVHGILQQALTDEKRSGARIASAIPIERVIEVDQRPIGGTIRSTPASYLGVWDHIRALFAQTIEAKARGWSASFFSYNTGKGRCPDCKGQGRLKLEMNFLPDAYVVCESCGGSRFALDALSVQYLGKNVEQVLALTFEEAAQLFVHHRKIHEPLKRACDLGIEYLTLGQVSSTLSGGECQRLKLASELGLRKKGHTLYLLDEPTTGLHKADVVKLSNTLRELTAQGNSVIVIEHDRDLILSADYVVEFGPGAGEAGGRVIFSGLPSALIAAETPWGRELRPRGVSAADQRSMGADDLT